MELIANAIFAGSIKIAFSSILCFYEIKILFQDNQAGMQGNGHSTCGSLQKQTDNQLV